MIDGGRLRRLGRIFAVGENATRLIDKTQMTQAFACCPKGTGLKYLGNCFSNSIP